MFMKSFNQPSFCNFLGFIACFSILWTDFNVVCRHQSTLFLNRVEVEFPSSETVQMWSVLVFAIVLQLSDGCQELSTPIASSQFIE